MSDSAKQLQSYIERIERLEEEKRALQGDIREIYAEAKANGFDPKIMRKVVAERRRNVADVEEEQALIDTYKVSLGMLRDTPLGDAAMRAAKKDYGRAAPRAAGTAPAESPSPPPESGVLRPGTDPASPDPAKCCDCADDIEPLHAMVHGGVRPLCRRCFDLRDGDAAKYPGLTKLRAEQRAKNDSEPPDIPPFLDRRAKGEQTHLEEFTGAPG